MLVCKRLANLFTLCHREVYFLGISRTLFLPTCIAGGSPSNEAEIRYRLVKFLLFRLQEENLLTPEESEKARQALCKKYKPFTYSLEVDEPWMNGK